MRTFLTLIVLLNSTTLFAQYKKLSQEKSHSFNKPHFSFVIAHTILPEGSGEGSQTYTIPSLGFDIEYFFNSRIGVGLHNDIELKSYEVKQDKDSYLKRAFPVLVTADFLYKVNPDLILFGGPGIEFEKENNLPVVRMGVEYFVHSGEHLTFSPIITYDHRIKSFNSISIGIGIGFSF